MNPNIQQATLANLNVTSKILTEAAIWLKEKGEPLWTTNELKPDKIKEDVTQGLFYIAYLDEKAAGVFKFQLEDKLFWSDVPNDESAFIHRIAVRRKFAGGAISSAMIEYAKKKTIKLGRRFLRLDCDASRPKLCAVYEKQGFTKYSNQQVGAFYIARYQIDLKR